MEKLYSFDVSEAEFEQKVVQRSRELPILVDFWAPWCAPCKQLGPVLEKLAAEHQGRFELAKVNVDQAQQLAMMLRIQSIPMVYLFVGGQPIDGFQGVQPESQIRQLLEKHLPPPKEDPMQLARDALVEGRFREASQLLEEVLRERPQDGEALLGMARIALMQGDLESAERFANTIDEEDSHFSAAQRLKQVFGFGEEAGSEMALRERLEFAPEDVAAWFSLGATLALENRLQEALDAFMEVVKRDRGFREDGGRKAILSLFALLGPEDPMLSKYRRRLALYIF